MTGVGSLEKTSEIDQPVNHDGEDQGGGEAEVECFEFPAHLFGSDGEFPASIQDLHADKRKDSGPKEMIFEAFVKSAVCERADRTCEAAKSAAHAERVTQETAQRRADTEK